MSKRTIILIVAAAVPVLLFAAMQARGSSFAQVADNAQQRAGCLAIVDAPVGEIAEPKIDGSGEVAGSQEGEHLFSLSVTNPSQTAQYVGGTLDQLGTTYDPATMCVRATDPDTMLVGNGKWVRRLGPTHNSSAQFAVMATG